MKTMSQSPSLLLGTRNEGKLREILTILGDIPFRVHSLREFPDVGVAAESGETYSENAIAKAQFYARETAQSYAREAAQFYTSKTAQFYARETGLWTLADDSGLEVDALRDAPGVVSARYAGANASDADRRRLLLSELADVPPSDRTARFVCVVAIATADGKILNVSEGTCSGTITFEPRGSGGFGYDPLFIPDGFDQTFAELSDSIKNRISHRALALLKTRKFLTAAQE